jgi:hypothetical protein
LATDSATSVPSPPLVLDRDLEHVPAPAPDRDRVTHVVDQERLDPFVGRAAGEACGLAQRPRARLRVGGESSRREHAAQERGALHLVAHDLGLPIGTDRAHHPAQRPRQLLGTLEQQRRRADVNGRQQQGRAATDQDGGEPRYDEEQLSTTGDAEQVAGIERGGFQ